ncbi:hypothetical protein MSG28_010330 [Choristoneura fumiferana]|uniref:Uncharacterized protein n=1 Tax=Choristoneura fumiferana TaxID=7141 RepID=A0ACC0KKR1_CHOFU|nr:hypothetical protein MSG28_010330 [Choristoneura fumiferana]
MNKLLLREDSIKWIEEPVKNTVEKFVQYWKTEVKDGTVANLESDCIDCLRKRTLRRTSNYALRNCQKIFQTTTKLFGLPLNLCLRLNLNVWRNFKESVDMSLLLAQKLVSEMLLKRDDNNGSLHTHQFGVYSYWHKMMKYHMKYGQEMATLHEYIDKRHKQLGPIFYEKLEGDTKLVFVSDPMLIKSVFLSLEGKYPAHILPEPWVLYEKFYGSKRGLFFMNGEEWLTNRRIMNKLLLREDSIKWIEEPVKNTVEKFVQYWKTEVKDGTVANLESDLYRLSTEAQKLVSEMLLKRDDNNGLVHKLLAENVSDNLIIRIVADFIIAAGDTTAYTSIWSLFLLAQNDEISHEIRTGNIGYVKNVNLCLLSPSLRRKLRIPEAPSELEQPYSHMKDETPIIASIYTSGRDEQYFSKAHKFLPYRWDRNDPRRKDLVNHVTSASVPFALGARTMNFIMKYDIGIPNTLQV